jgi:hypothetical protein
MTRIGLPTDIGARKARTALRTAKYKVGNDIVAAAVKARKLAATCPEVDADTQRELFGSPETMCPRSPGDTSEAAQTCPQTVEDTSPEEGR